jgi:TetR/AcrR family transcriptional repressor of nem operon
MPWPRDHKEHTRRRIVGGASAELREKGVSGVGVAGIMARAGLTHGGFYAHFASKDDLMRAALADAECQTQDLLSGAAAAASEGQRLEAVIDTYLDPAHAAHPERGCPVAALGPELARIGGPMHRNLGRAIRRRISWLRTLDAGGHATRRDEDRAVGALACMIGGLILARAAGRGESDAILDSCRRFLKSAVDDLPERR